MEKYITNISNREAIFSDENIKIGNLVLPYDKMSNIKYRKGDNPGFILDFDGRNLLIPCGAEEKDKLMPFFQHAVMLKRIKEEAEKDLTSDNLVFNTSEEEKEGLMDNKVEDNLIPPMATPPIGMEEPEEPKFDPMLTTAYDPSVDSPHYDENTYVDNQTDLDDLQQEIQRLKEENEKLYEEKNSLVAELQKLKLENNHTEIPNFDFNENNFVEKPIPMEVPSAEIAQPMEQEPQMETQNIISDIPQDILQQLPETENPNNEIFKTQNFSDQVQQPVNTDPIEQKPFWKVGRLVVGIISMVLCGLITFQSCAAGLSNALAENESLSGSAGLFLAIFMLAGGIVGVATRKSVKKGGCMASAILYELGAGIGATSWNSDYSDLRVWIVVSLIFSLFYLFCAIKTKTKKKGIVGYIIYGILIACLIGGIALGGSDSTTTNSTSTNDTTTTTTTEEQNEQVAEESKYPMTVENNEYFTLEVINAEYDSIFGEDINCKFTNKTDQNVIFAAKSIILNGETTTDASMMFKADGNTSNKDNFIIDTEDFDEFKDSPVEITVKYYMYNNDDWEDITEGEFKFTVNK